MIENLRKRDFYELLGVARDATLDEIKRAYRCKAREQHPDIARDCRDAESNFKEINEAYSVLSDGEKRNRYDRLSHHEIDEEYEEPPLPPSRNEWPDMFTFFNSFLDFEELSLRTFRTHCDLWSMWSSSLRTVMSIHIENPFARSSFSTQVEPLFADEEPHSGKRICPFCRGTSRITQVSWTPFGKITSTYTCPCCFY